MKKLNYSWIICAGSTLTMFCVVGLTFSAFPVYLPYLIEAGGLSETMGSAIYTVRSTFALLAMFLVVKYIRFIGIRIGTTLAIVGTALSLAVFGLSESITGYFTAAAIAGISYGLGGMVPAAILVDRWFVSRRAFALGIVSAGSGMATIIIPPIVVTLIETYSLRFAFLAEAAFVALASIVVFIIVRNHPEEKNTSPLLSDFDQKNGTVTCNNEDPERRVMVLMCIAIFLVGISAYASIQYMAALYIGEGIDPLTVSFLISFYGIIVTVGKCLFGQVTDRIGSYRSVPIFVSLFVTSLILLSMAWIGSLGIAVVAMIVMGFGITITTVGLAVFARDMSSAENYGKTVRRFQVFFAIGGVVGVQYPGPIADATGSYVPAYVLSTFIGAAFMLIVLGCYRSVMAKTPELAVVSQKVDKQIIGKKSEKVAMQEQ